MDWEDIQPGTFSGLRACPHGLRCGSVGLQGFPAIHPVFIRRLLGGAAQRELIITGLSTLVFNVARQATSALTSSLAFPQGPDHIITEPHGWVRRASESLDSYSVSGWPLRVPANCGLRSVLPCAYALTGSTEFTTLFNGGRPPREPQPFG